MASNCVEPKTDEDRKTLEPKWLQMIQRKKPIKTHRTFMNLEIVSSSSLELK